MDDSGNIFDRIGGADGVSRLVDSFYGRVTADPELTPFFANTSMEKLREIQREFITQALGGPLSYSGRPLSEVHHGRGIRMKHFQRWVDHFLETLNGLKLTRAEIDEIIARVVVDADAIVGETAIDG